MWVSERRPRADQKRGDIEIDVSVGDVEEVSVLSGWSGSGGTPSKPGTAALGSTRRAAVFPIKNMRAAWFVQRCSRVGPDVIVSLTAQPARRP